jgi:hypothetical protein
MRENIKPLQVTAYFFRISYFFHIIIVTYVTIFVKLFW